MPNMYLVSIIKIFEPCKVKKKKQVKLERVPDIEK
jgi:hypothetical protein